MEVMMQGIHRDCVGKKRQEDEWWNCLDEEIARLGTKGPTDLESNLEIKRAALPSRPSGPIRSSSPLYGNGKGGANPDEHHGGGG